MARKREQEKESKQNGEEIKEKEGMKQGMGEGKRRKGREKGGWGLGGVEWVVLFCVGVCGVVFLCSLWRYVQLGVSFLFFSFLFFSFFL